jgi:hypothetical protein
MCQPTCVLASPGFWNLAPLTFPASAGALLSCGRDSGSVLFLEYTVNSIATTDILSVTRTTFLKELPHTASDSRDVLSMLAVFVMGSAEQYSEQSPLGNIILRLFAAPHFTGLSH